MVKKNKKAFGAMKMLLIAAYITINGRRKAYEGAMYPSLTENTVKPVLRSLWPHVASVVGRVEKSAVSLFYPQLMLPYIA